MELYENSIKGPFQFWLATSCQCSDIDASFFLSLSEGFVLLAEIKFWSVSSIPRYLAIKGDVRRKISHWDSYERKAEAEQFLWC